MLSNSKLEAESLAMVLQEMLPQPASEILMQRFPRTVENYFDQIIEGSSCGHCSGSCRGQGGCMAITA